MRDPSHPFGRFLPIRMVGTGQGNSFSVVVFTMKNWSDMPMRKYLDILNITTDMNMSDWLLMQE